MANPLTAKNVSRETFTKQKHILNVLLSIIYLHRPLHDLTTYMI